MKNTRQFIPEFNSELIVKIGVRLPQLSQKDCVGIFWLTMYKCC